MGSTREIITLQSGNHSNYVGAHWWNIQESYFQCNAETPSEICHDILFREGKTLQGHVTFTPRVILLDSKDNALNLPIIDEPVVKSPPTTWDPDKLVTEYQPVPEKHKFIQDLEQIEQGTFVDLSHKEYQFQETVRTWCDYVKTRFHRRSPCFVDPNLKTDRFTSGGDLFKNVEETVTDNIRSYIEECDNLQGFQVLADAVDGFGGVADSILLHIQDEYPSKTVLTFPIVPSYYPDPTPLQDVSRMINILLSYQKLAENSSLLVPISTNKTAWRNLGSPIEFPNLVYDQKSAYQTSAILASYLDTVSLKYRLRDDWTSLHDVVSGLSFSDRKICAGSLNLPFPMTPDSYLLDTLEDLEESKPLWTQLTPGCDIDNNKIYFQRLLIRGIPVERLRNPEVVRPSNQAYSCATVEELVRLYLSFRANTVSDVSSASTTLQTSTPFPKIFSPHVSCLGSVDTTAVRANNFDVASCPMIAGIHSCKDVGRMLDSLLNSVKAVNVKKFNLVPDMDFDEYNECLEKVYSMCHGYDSDMEFS